MSNGNVPQTLWHQQGVRIPSSIFTTSADGVRHVAMMVENLIREKQSAGLPCVLGLPTGSTPVSVYRELVKAHRERGLAYAAVCVVDNYASGVADSPLTVAEFEAGAAANVAALTATLRRVVPELAG